MINGIHLLIADHERVDELFDRFEATGDATLVGQIVDALSAHDQAEHAALYPLAGALLDDADLVQRSSRAHSLVKKWIEHLVNLEGPPLTEAVGELRLVVAQHVEDEEGNLFPALSDVATPDQLDGLAARIEQNKQRVG